MILLECPYDPPHVHEFPSDWIFAGASGTDPRADSRWRPTTYIYLGADLREVWTTQSPLCDDEALDEFTKHRGVGAVYLQVRRPGRDVELLDWQYDGRTDTLIPLGGA